LEQLAAFVSIMTGISRKAEAIALLSRIVEIQPDLSPNNRVLFVSTFKSIVDIHRANLRHLVENAEKAMLRSEAPEIYNAIDSLIDKEFKDLIDVIDTSFSLVDDFLLPAARNSEAKVVYKKFKGDLSRYICEFATDSALEDAKTNAEIFYSEAVELSWRDLPPHSPVRLGTFLNYAVFKYGHCHESELASELIQRAINDNKNGSSGPNTDSLEDAAHILSVMRSNLTAWAAGDSESPSECENA
jgi:hypothetical protein